MNYFTFSIFTLKILHCNLSCIGIGLLLLLEICLANDAHPKAFLKRENSLVKPYTDDRWDFIGSTIVTNGYVRLTPDQKSASGAIWNNVPCPLSDWELHVHFKVHGSGKELFGDGLVIWYTKSRLEAGPVFGSKDYFVGLAVILDTYANQNGPHNHGHPYISAMVNNGSLHYDHDRDGTHTELSGCEAQFRQSHSETFLAIRYERNKLTVSTDIYGKNSWRPCFSVEGVKLPPGYFFGASAATGDLSDNHDIISMKLYDIGVQRKDDELNSNLDQPSAAFFAPPRDHVEDPKPLVQLTGWRTALYVFLALIGLAICIAVGYVVYTQSRQNSRKRFY